MKSVFQEVYKEHFDCLAIDLTNRLVHSQGLLVTDEETTFVIKLVKMKNLGWQIPEETFWMMQRERIALDRRRVGVLHGMGIEWANRWFQLERLQWRI